MSVGHFQRADSILKPEEGSVVHRGQKRCQFFRGRCAGDEMFSTVDSSGRSPAFCTVDRQPALAARVSGQGCCGRQ